MTLHRFTIAALFTAVAAGTWDAWWHGALGRETFWSPPHLLLYAAVIAAVCAGWYRWRQTRDRLWRRLAFVLLLVPLSAPFDELWHRTFGIESAVGPLIIWSPPHLVLIGAIVAALLLTLPVLARDPDRDARRLFGALALAAVWALLMFVAAPLEPTGPYHVAGFWGAAVPAAIAVGVLTYSRRWMAGVGGAVATVFPYLALTAIGFAERMAPATAVPPHGHAQPWVIVFATLLTALVIELSGRRLAVPVQAAISGLLWATLTYGIGGLFMEPAFVPAASGVLIAIIASGLGGMVAGSVIAGRAPSGNAGTVI